MNIDAAIQAHVEKLSSQMETVGAKAVSEMLEMVPLPWHREAIAGMADRLVDNLADSFLDTWDTLDDEGQEIVLGLVNSARLSFIRRAVEITQAFEKVNGGLA